ncbi:hypothetical protein NQ315_004979 [Exocentrus adspersus]|uniref:Tetratricopeptide repeat protein 37 n=1 Tax=Exocentrus adspersus TaxID=1586481 RepID=A0AAV8V636_9CUCU|nr:hypothetical protein NQ315_004979 [Exocentrus adspersus]
MYQARECYRDQRIGTARDHAQVVLDKLILAIEQSSKLSCLWKLLADTCFFVAKLPEKYCCMMIPKSFLEGGYLKETTFVEKEDLYKMAARFYCKAINLTEDNVLIWHDLGVCYLYHAMNTEGNGKQQLFLYSLAVARHCTSTNPSRWQHWNLLGNVAMRKDPPNYALGQHAFIKAVTADHNTAVAWTNLGILYLLMDNIKLANKAFSQGQRSDPNYVNSWIGQALIAEKMGHEEAMDLFRHSTQLGQQQQGSLGYGHWVCQTLLTASDDVNIYSVHNMHAVPVACDVLTWYTDHPKFIVCRNPRVQFSAY